MPARALSGVPIAYPRMVALENVLESKLNPMAILAKMKIMPSAVNKFNACVSLLTATHLGNEVGADSCVNPACSEAELKDDLADHPCAVRRLLRWFARCRVDFGRLRWLDSDGLTIPLCPPLTGRPQEGAQLAH